MNNEGKGHDVLFITSDTDGIAVIEQTFGRGMIPDAKFTASVKVFGEWTPIRRYFQTAEHAFLGALGFKYEGANSKFEYYASKMILPKED